MTHAWLLNSWGFPKELIRNDESVHDWHIFVGNTEKLEKGQTLHLKTTKIFTGKHEKSHQISIFIPKMIWAVM